MSNATSEEKELSKPAEVEEKKSSLFGRFFQKLDDSMKQKADEQAKQDSGCCGTDSNGNKCC